MGTPRVGIIGAGQLGRMMALAAYPLGIECRFIDSQPLAPGGQIAPMRVAALDDETELRALAQEVDVLTFDIENVSVQALENLTSIVPVRPPPAIVAKGQDRLLEKQMFESLGIPTAAYQVIDTSRDLGQAADRLGWPIVLKARRLGYDGRGQRLANSANELLAAWEDLDRRPAIAEGWIDFECEVSLIGVRGHLRGQQRQIAFYPLSENRHRDGMLESSIAPFSAEALQAQAQFWMAAMMNQHDYAGVLTIEFFVTADGLIANEVAPRVHNSGHWTIEGAETSQFENHVRAILGLPLGSTRTHGTALMRNLIGSVPPREKLLAIDGLHLHDYGKEPRPARKVGHCTLLAPDRPTALLRLSELESIFPDSEK
jgi:5-(carboxyamino)imidazole ribonucleotide synthase